MRKESVILLNITLALVLAGLLAVFSASPVIASKLYGYDPMHFAWRQVGFAIAGLAAMAVAIRFDYRKFRDPFLYRILAYVSLGFLVAVLIPGIGIEVDGARRWIRFFGFQFQPSEMAKITLVILLAVKLCERQERIKHFVSGFLPPLCVTLLFAVLVLAERDLGSPVVMVGAAMCMIWMGGASLFHLGLCAVPGLAALVGLILSQGYRLDRVQAWLDPWQYRSEEGLQLIQSMTAFARGGLWGQGPGAGEQKLLWLPAAHTDFIFAVWGEEFGLAGSLVMVALFILLLVMAFRVAVCARDLFGALLAGGIGALITIEAVLNMAVTTGLMPTKGLSLPFISAGGSGLFFKLLMVGILINVGLQAHEPLPQKRPAPAH